MFAGHQDHSCYILTKLLFELNSHTNFLENTVTGNPVNTNFHYIETWVCLVEYDLKNLRFQRTLSRLTLGLGTRKGNSHRTVGHLHRAHGTLEADL